MDTEVNMDSLLEAYAKVYAPEFTEENTLDWAPEPYITPQEVLRRMGALIVENERSYKGEE